MTNTFNAYAIGVAGAIQKAKLGVNSIVEKVDIQSNTLKGDIDSKYVSPVRAFFTDKEYDLGYSPMIKQMMEEEGEPTSYFEESDFKRIKKIA